MVGLNMRLKIGLGMMSGDDLSLARAGDMFNDFSGLRVHPSANWPSTITDWQSVVLYLSS